MKIAFSTLSCPNYGWSDIFTMAKDLGFDGIEVREIKDEIATSPFSPEKCEATAKKMADMKLEIPCLSTGSCLKFADKWDETYAEITKYIGVAGKIGAKYIRILADLDAAPDGEVDDSFIAEAVKKLIPEAEKCGVTLLIDTNGVYADTKRLCDLLRLWARLPQRG